MTQLLNWKTYQVLFDLKIIENNQILSKKGKGLNRLREGTAAGYFGDKALRSNHWTVRGTLLQTNFDNWAVFQELLDDILEGKVDSVTRGQVIRVQTQKQSFNIFFNTTWSCFDAQRQLLLLCNTHTSCYKGQ